jgi:hypothetical protein
MEIHIGVLLILEDILSYQEDKEGDEESLKRRMVHLIEPRGWASWKIRVAYTASCREVRGGSPSHGSQCLADSLPCMRNDAQITVHGVIQPIEQRSMGWEGRYGGRRLGDSIRAPIPQVLIGLSCPIHGETPIH